MSKLTVLYGRISTDGQNVEMQVTSAQEIMKDIPEEKKRILIDDGVSANKIKMPNRKKLQELLGLIRDGKVETLVVYDRDRLARKFYEYLEIARLLLDHKVKVIFTGSNVRPFDKSLVIEAIAAMFAQFEGQTIARRRADAQKQYPSSLIGFKRNKSEADKTITFTPDDHASDIRLLFEEVATVEDPNAFLSIVKAFKRRLQRDEIRLIGILQTPFYAGCWEQTGAFKPLDHVQPIISVTLYEQVQAKLLEFRVLTNRITAPNDDPALVALHCGICGTQMKYRHVRLEGTSYYACPNHRKNFVSVEKIVAVTKEVLEQKIQSLDVGLVENECGVWLRQHRRKLALETVKSHEQLNRIALFVVNNYRNADSEGLVNRLLAEQRQLEVGLGEIRTMQEKYDILAAQLHQLTALVTRHLQAKLARPEEMSTLARMMIRRLEVSSGRLDFHMNFSRFFTQGGDRHDAS